MSKRRSKGRLVLELCPESGCVRLVLQRGRVKARLLLKPEEARDLAFGLWEAAKEAELVPDGVKIAE